MIVAACIGLIIGMLIGRFFRDPEETCPREVMGYYCNGYSCDHRKSELYRAKMDRALRSEERSPDENYWRGDD